GRGQKKKSSGKRRPFTLEEMHALLSHKNYREKSFTHPYAYWLIPLATFTGARLGELCWLDLKDFVEHDGIPCIDVNDEEADKNSQEAAASKKRVKNENAKRLIPIHPQLLEMGLLRYVETLRKR